MNQTASLAAGRGGRLMLNRWPCEAFKVETAIAKGDGVELPGRWSCRHTDRPSTAAAVDARPQTAILPTLGRSVKGALGEDDEPVGGELLMVPRTHLNGPVIALIQPGPKIRPRIELAAKFSHSGMNSPCSNGPP